MDAQTTGVGFPLQVEEEIPMTLQVGMVGTDGVLIAGDTRWTEESGSLVDPWDATKLVVDHERGIAVSRSGKMLIAKRLADAIIADKNQDWLNEIGGKQKLEAAALSSAQGDNQHCQCLAAFIRPTVKLYRFQTVMIGKEWGLVFDEMLSIAFAGDVKNSAKFWAERYYPRHPRVPVRQLVPLAAHLITAAHYLNTRGIDGLEMMLCDENGLHSLSDKSIKELELRSAQREERIRESLLSDSAYRTEIPVRTALGWSQFGARLRRAFRSDAGS